MSTNCPHCSGPATSAIAKCFGQVGSIYCKSCNSNLGIPLARNMKNVVVGLILFVFSYVISSSLLGALALSSLLLICLTYREPFVVQDS